MYFYRYSFNSIFFHLSFKIVYEQYAKSNFDLLSTSIESHETQSDNFFSKIYSQTKRSRTESAEIFEYLSARIEPSNKDPLEFWKNNATKYPILAKMAADYLAIPASSVPVECVFSDAKNLVSFKRKKLQAKSIKAIMCLNSWL